MTSEELCLEVCSDYIFDAREEFFKCLAGFYDVQFFPLCKRDLLGLIYDPCFVVVCE